MQLIVIYIIRILQLMLFIRAILSWIPGMQGNKFSEILYYATEPMLSPVRKLLFKFEKMRYLPIDLSWLIVYFILLFIERFLYSL